MDKARRQKIATMDDLWRCLDPLMPDKGTVCERKARAFVPAATPRRAEAVKATQALFEYFTSTPDDKQAQAERCTGQQRVEEPVQEE